MTIAVLANPAAGKGRRRAILPELLEQLAGAGPIHLLEADSAALARLACREAVAAGVDALVAAGGDGTVHLALQAVAETGVPLGILPVGTGNDFAVAMGVPVEPQLAASAIAEDVAAGEPGEWVDLGRISTVDGSRVWFGAVLACGFDAIVSERANQMHWPRGDRRYDIAILLELARLRPRRYALRVDGGETHHLDAVLVTVGNTSSYGGGMLVCPDADPTDGRLDVLIAGPVSRTEFIRIKPLVYTGAHVDHPAVHTFRASTVDIYGPGVITYADGERALALPLTATAVPRALHLLGTRSVLTHHR